MKHLDSPDALNPGDILLFSRARGINRIITWATRSPFYHVALYTGDFQVVEARPRGVVARDLRKRDGGGVCFKVVPAPEGKGVGAVVWARTQIGDSYDVVGVLVLVLERLFVTLNLNYTARDKFSCAEFVATVYREVGVTLFPDLLPRDVVPADFERLLPAGAEVCSFAVGES